MTKAILIALVLLLVIPATSYSNGVDSRAPAERSRPEPIPTIQTPSISRDIVRVPRGLLSTATPDTTWLGYWDFDGSGGVCDPQGWVSVDMGARSQDGVYWHVDDFVGLGGGDFGRLVPIEGSQSMWLGLRDSPELGCEYATLPGYGDSWLQVFFTVDCLSVTGDATIDFLQTFDTELAYDFVYVQFDTCDGIWQTIATYDGIGSGFYSHTVPAAQHNGSLRFRLYFTSDWAWSDADGDPNTDGATIIDSLTVSDTTGVVLPTELFEVEAVGDTATVSGNWAADALAPPAPYGDFSGLFSGLDVVQEDVCNQNLTCLWGFFKGSTYDYTCGGFPAQPAVPYMVDGGPTTPDSWIWNEVWSPVLPIAGSGSNFVLEFDVYRDLPLNALVFYVWWVRTWQDGDECPGEWKSRGSVYYGGQKKWFTDRRPFGDLIVAGADSLQVALGVEDRCWVWGGVYGDCQCHSHAPLFDNVRVYRVDSNGPLWEVRSLNLFQDNFAADGTTTGTVRADMANDILPSSSAGILPGDSVAVGIIDPESGLGFHVPGDASSGPAAYCYVSVDGPNEAANGAALVDDPRYDVVGTQAIYGRTWTRIQMDTCYTVYGSVVADRFNVDFNDALFVPGDTVHFFFGATGGLPGSETNYWSEFTGTTDDLVQVATSPMEFTCLPASGWTNGGDMLYVDAADGSGAQTSFDAAFQALGLSQWVDRYDQRAPESRVGNGLASRVVDVHAQILGIYGRIIWNTGTLPHGPGDGDNYNWVNGAKQDDFLLLLTFARDLSGPGGLYLSGDDVADYWENDVTGTAASNLRNEYCNFTYGGNVGGDPFPRPEISPLVIGEPGSFFVNGVPDSLVAYGGCPEIRDFDVVDATGLSEQAMSYYSQGSGSGAVVSQATVNLVGDTVGVVLSGYSFDAVRDDRPAEFNDQVVHLDRILTWLGSRIVIGVGDDGPVFQNTLSQNHPNPFNPTTTIAYSIDERAEVHMAVYNVSGQLVRTLVNGVQEPGIVHKVTWDGSNNAGQGVASGVYFYRLVSKNFTRTKKMVLLK